MSQAALLKSFASSFSNQALGGLTNGTKGASLEGAVEIARFNVTLGDLLLPRLELGAKAANAIAKQIKRVDLAVELRATYGNQGVCHLAKKLAQFSVQPTQSRRARALEEETWPKLCFQRRISPNVHRSVAR
jgi:hypothetical protein